ncbi:MAG TPA: Gfo/Idh/MocA family oxidoreductase [Tepidisphaeraceae bacterium]|nr:Gfo/Idh/MocA family oxidoreductase [Tepidisphaeraceae bacterium]
MSDGTKRRDFLKYTAATGMGFWVAGTKTWAQEAESKSPNERVNFACVGVSGKGDGDSSQAAEVGNVIAICDTSERALNHKAQQIPAARKFNDFRKLFDEMGKDIDAVTVSIPDHNHAVVAMMGIKNKKAVYVQKPMTHYVAEARALRLAANEYKVATQMGNQGSAASGLRAGVEAIQAGAIGHVRAIHVWTNRPIWPQAPMRTDRPMADDKPETINWDAWLGPAPYRPYVAKYPGAGQDPRCYEPFVWRGWWDFGTGALGDMACHTSNLPFRACKLDQVYPTRVHAQSGIVNFETYPSWASIVWDFPARGDMPPLKFHWYEGQMEQDDGSRIHNWPPIELFYGKKVSDSGSIMVGDKGVMYSPNDYGAQWFLLPEEKFRNFKAPEPTIPRMTSENPPAAGRGGRGRGGNNTDLWMKKELVAAIKGGPPAYSNFNFAGKLTECILLGNAAIRAGYQHPLEYDAEAMKFTNWPEANAFLSREYRKGYSL